MPGLLDGNVAHVKFLHNVILLLEIWLFVQEVNLAWKIFPSPSNVIIGNGLVFVLEGNVACTRLLWACNDVVGNMFVFCVRSDYRMH